MKRYLAYGMIFAMLFLPCHAASLSWAGPGASLPPARSVRVGDIDMGYRIMGDGYPLVLITGYGATMDVWDPVVLSELSSRYKVIIFDNRGIGRTSASAKGFTIEGMAADTLGLMDALKVEKAHVLGWSMGTFVATELALRHPDRVDKLVLYAGTCGWDDPVTVKAAPEVDAALMDLTGAPEERARRFISILFSRQWLDDHPGFAGGLPRPEIPALPVNIERQGKAIRGWAGTCGRLPGLARPTLVITGTEDIVIPPANSVLMASRIPGAWLIRMPGGHANMYQYPRTFSRYIAAFLDGQSD